MHKLLILTKYIFLGDPRNIGRKIFVIAHKNIPFFKKDKKLVEEIFKRKSGVRIGGKLNGIFQKELSFSNKIIDVDGSETFLGNQNKINYKSDATKLNFIKSHSQDFICSSHLLEHISNPIKAINEWKRILKKEGIIYCAIPDKRFTFDHKREVTSLSHLIEDYKRNILPGDEIHVKEFLKNWDGDMDGLSRNEFKKLVMKNYSINVHHHVWTKKEVKELFEYLNLKILLIKLRGNTVHIISKV